MKRRLKLTLVTITAATGTLVAGAYLPGILDRQAPPSDDGHTAQAPQQLVVGAPSTASSQAPRLAAQTAAECAAPAIAARIDAAAQSDVEGPDTNSPATPEELARLDMSDSAVQKQWELWQSLSSEDRIFYLCLRSHQG